MSVHSFDPPSAATAGTVYGGTGGGTVATAGLGGAGGAPRMLSHVDAAGYVVASQVSNGDGTTTLYVTDDWVMPDREDAEEALRVTGLPGSAIYAVVPLRFITPQPPIR